MPSKYEREWMFFAAAALTRMSDGNDPVQAAKSAASHADAMIAELERRDIEFREKERSQKNKKDD